MKVIIDVDCCNECPHEVECGPTEPNYCSKMESKSTYDYLTPLSGIPSWCPLRS